MPDSTPTILEQELEKAPSYDIVKNEHDTGMTAAAYLQTALVDQSAILAQGVLPDPNQLFTDFSTPIAAIGTGRLIGGIASTALGYAGHLVNGINQTFVYEPLNKRLASLSNFLTNASGITDILAGVATGAQIALTSGLTGGVPDLAHTLVYGISAAEFTVSGIESLITKEEIINVPKKARYHHGIADIIQIIGNTARLRVFDFYEKLAANIIPTTHDVFFNFGQGVESDIATGRFLLGLISSGASVLGRIPFFRKLSAKSGYLAAAGAFAQGLYPLINYIVYHEGNPLKGAAYIAGAIATALYASEADHLKRRIKTPRRERPAPSP